MSRGKAKVALVKDGGQTGVSAKQDRQAAGGERVGEEEKGGGEGGGGSLLGLGLAF